MAMVIWGSSFVVLKYALQSATPMVIVFGRLLTASILFLLMWPLIKPAAIHRQDWKALLLMALFEPCIYFLFEAKALQLTTASQAGMITAMLPVMVGVVAYFTLGERVSKQSWAGFLIAFLGVVWLSLQAEQDSSAPNPLLGNFYELMAMLCAAFYTIVIKKLSNRYKPLFLTAVQSFVGAVFFLPLAAWEGFPASLPLEAGASIVYLGAVVTLAAYGLFNFGISQVPVSTASAYVNLIPVFTVLLAVVWLGESLAAGQITAIALIAFGVFFEKLLPSKLKAGCNTARV
nr:DMT family transporter [Sansalvadorimonas sp. 2012CJ34-2]